MKRKELAEAIKSINGKQSTSYAAETVEMEYGGFRDQSALAIFIANRENYTEQGLDLAGAWEAAYDAADAGILMGRM